MKLAKHAYERLVAEDIEWLRLQPECLEREHIEVVLRNSVAMHYPEPNDRDKPEPPCGHTTEQHLLMTQGLMAGACDWYVGKPPVSREPESGACRACGKTLDESDTAEYVKLTGYCSLGCVEDGPPPVVSTPSCDRRSGSGPCSRFQETQTPMGACVFCGWAEVAHDAPREAEPSAREKPEPPAIPPCPDCGAAVWAGPHEHDCPTGSFRKVSTPAASHDSSWSPTLGCIEPPRADGGLAGDGDAAFGHAPPPDASTPRPITDAEYAACRVRQNKYCPWLGKDQPLPLSRCPLPGPWTRRWRMSEIAVEGMAIITLSWAFGIVLGIVIGREWKRLEIIHGIDAVVAKGDAIIYTRKPADPGRATDE